MRRTLPLLAATLLVGSLAGTLHGAELDRTLNIQGAVYTSAGMPAQGTFGMTFRLYDAASGGTKLWEQAVPNVGVVGGVFDTLLGPLPAGVLEGAGSVWLETDVEGTVLPRQPFRSVPYSLVSQTALVAQDLQCSGCVGPTDLADGAITPAKLSSGLYGINISGNAATATTAASAATAAAFSGALAGDVTGGQGATTVGKIRGVTVAPVAPNSGQVLKYNAAQQRWEPSADDNGGGSVTSVGTGGGLTGGPITGAGTIDLKLATAGGLSKSLGTGSDLGIAAAGIQPAMVASGLYGISISGNAATATTATGFGGVLAGDVAGTQGATSVQKIRGVAVAGTTPAANQVLKYNATSSQWEPGADATGGTVTQVSTGAGLQGGPITTSGTVALRLNAGGGLSSGLGAATNELGIAAGGVTPGMVSPGTYGVNISGNAATATIATTADSLSGPLAGDVTGGQGTTKVVKIQGVDVATAAPTGGQVLKFNSTSGKWEPGTDSNGLGGTVSSVNTGAGLAGGPITSSGTIDLKLASAGGLSKALGSGSDLGIAAGGVVPTMVASGTYGINVSGNAATATTATSASTATNFTGALAGDVTGNQATTKVAKIQGVSVSATAPTGGQVLKFNSTSGLWAPAADNAGDGGTVTTVNTGAGLSGGPITTAGTIDLKLASAGGLSKTLNTNELGIAAGGVVPAMVGSGLYGINISGNAATATSATSATSATTATSATSFTGALNGDVTGNQTTTKVGKIQGVTVSATAPTANQVLKYNGTQWAPATDASNSGTVTSVGTGQGLSGGTITTSGTINLSLNSAGGLSKTLGTGTNELGIAAGGVVPAMVGSGLYGINISGNAATATTATSATSATSATTATSFSGALNGDVTGNQTTTKVAKIQGVAVSTTAPTNNQVLKYNGTAWAPATDASNSGTVTSVATGQGLTGGTITTTGTINLSLNASGGLSKTLGTGTNELGIAAGGIVPAMVSSGLYGVNISGNAATATTATSATSATSATNFTGVLSGDVTGNQTTTKVTKVQGVAVSATAPTVNQVMKFNGTQWAPAADASNAGTVTSVATGQGLSGGTITTSGTVNLRLNAAGGLSKTLGTGTNELGIAAGGIVPTMVSSGLYGINVSGNAATATSATSATTATTATSFSGALDGDVTGNQTTTTVARIQGVGVATTAPAANQVLKYNGTQWAPAADAGGNGTVTSVATGQGLSGGTITTTGTVNLRLNATGGLSKTLGTGTNELGIAAGGIVPTMVSSGLYGINISGNAATATTATSATSATTASTATNFSGALGGDVTGSQTTTTVARIQGVGVATTAPTINQVMKFNGTQWAPATDASNSGTVTSVATGQGLSGGTITTTGTVNLRLNATGGLSKTLGTGTNELGIAANGIVPTMVSSGLYGINISGNAATATTATSATSATTATTATNFSGALNGDVTGNQTTTKVTKIQGVPVVTTAPTINQVMKFNGTQWAPAADASNAGTVTSVATGQGLSGGTITTTGTLTVRLNATGGLSKTLGTGTNELGIAAAGIVPAMVSSGLYGINISGNAATATSATSAASATTATNFSGTLNGDVTGNQTTTKVAKIQGVAVATTAPTTNQVLKYNGTQWAPATDVGGAGTVTSVATGQGLIGGTITSTGTIDLRLNTAGGLSKTLGTGTNELGIKAAGIVPSMVSNGTYTMSISGNAATATSATTATNATNFTGALNGDVTGNQTTAKVVKIQNVPVVTTVPTSGQVLKYNGTQWAPAADATGTGVTTVTASAPLASSGGTAPNISLTGTVAIARGGTGITTGPTAAGQFMRSTGNGAWGVSTIAAGDIPSGSNNYIRNGTGAQSASFNVTGTGAVATLSVTGTGTLGALAVTGASTMNGSLTARGGITHDGGNLNLNASTGIVNIGNYLYANSKHAIQATDAWLRLNQGGAFTSGIYSPGFLRVDGGFASGGVGTLGAGTINATSMIKMGNTSVTCSSTYAGAVRWNGTVFQGCNGTSWVTFSTTGGACSCPSGFTASGSNCVRNYDIAVGNLFGMSDFCGTGEYYNCSGAIGFTWTDLGSTVGAVSAVAISVSSGIVCAVGSSGVPNLNGTNMGTYAPPTNNCQCTAAKTIVALSGIPVGAYKKAQSNTVNLPMIGGTCTGLNQNSAFNNNYARVTVTYACQ